MNIEEFKIKYAAFRDSDKIEMQCDHPKHEPVSEIITIGKQPAKRNIMKSGGKQFVCRKCFMKHNNPANKVGKSRQDDSIIEVFCPHPNHENESSRQMKKSCYYGSMETPYLQICGSCVQNGKEISEEQREKIRMALTGIKRSEEFKRKISDSIKSNPARLEQAIKILKENHCSTGFLGKHHSDQTKKMMSELMSGRTYSEEHRQNISEGRKKMLEETGGFTPEHRKNISDATIRQYQNGFDPRTHHIRGHHDSSKIPSGRGIYRSSYEKKAFMILDSDESVVSYEIEKVTTEYHNPVKNIDSSYLIDIFVTYIDGTSKLIEVKPESWLLDAVVKTKIEAGKNKSAEMGVTFEVWTEMNLFGHVYNKKNIESFAEKVASEHQRENKNKTMTERSKRFYDKNIANDKVTVFCSFCQMDHAPLRLTHDKNIARNGRYICEREGGHMAGSRPKPHLQKDNPHLADGKKECLKCKVILDLAEFGVDKGRRDGLSSRCKKCRAASATSKYQAKTKKQDEDNNI